MDISSLARAEPILEVPLSRLRGNSQCATCRLFSQNQDLFEEISEGLVRNDTLTSLSLRLREAGYPISIGMLSKHKKNHMDETMWELGREAASEERGVTQALGISSGDVAQGIAKLLGVKAIRGVKKIDKDFFNAMAVDNPEKLVAISLQIAQTLSQIAKAQAALDLLLIRLQIDRVRANASTEAQLTRAMQSFRKELEDTPEGLRLFGLIRDYLQHKVPSGT